MRLKPWRSSTTKVRQRSKGSAASVLGEQHAEDGGEVARVARRRAGARDSASIAAMPPPSVSASSSTPSIASVSASAEALLVERVVGGACGAPRAGSSAAKSAGTLVAMARHVARLAQPSHVRHASAATHEGGEDGGEGGGAHGLDDTVRVTQSARDSRDSMAQDKTPLVWVDMEMSGLVPERDRILEVALVVTDAELNTIAEAPVYVIHQPDEVLDAMDSWNKSTHGKSGLVDKVRASTFTEAEVEARLVEFLKPSWPSARRRSRATPCTRTAASWRATCPLFDAYLHYRIVDVSTLKELAKRWRPEVLAGVAKEGKHEALADVYESIEELRHYRRHFLAPTPPALQA